MTLLRWIMLILVQILAGACGQDELIIPEQPVGGACGDYYPGSGTPEGETGDIYGVEEGELFPCIAFETARLAGEDIFIHFAEEYLKAKHGDSDLEFIIIIVTADHCPGCAVLVNEMAELAGAFSDAGTLLIGVAWCDNIDLNDCDFDIDEAESVLASEGWLVDRWPVTNDTEEHLRPGFGDAFPSAVTIRLSDMRVLSVDLAPTAEALLTRVE